MLNGSKSTLNIGNVDRMKCNYQCTGRPFVLDRVFEVMVLKVECDGACASTTLWLCCWDSNMKFQYRIPSSSV
jgi:hypothetical protein